MSYDLCLTGDGELDLDLARSAFGGDPDCDELLWLRGALSCRRSFADSRDVRPRAVCTAS